MIYIWELKEDSPRKTFKSFLSLVFKMIIGMNKENIFIFCVTMGEIFVYAFIID